MTIGISGSGKSTYLKKRFKPEVVITPDNIRKEMTGDISNHSMEPVVWATATHRIKEALEKYGEAVLDATNVNAKYRHGFLTPFRQMGNVELVALVFEPNTDLAKQRVQKDVETGVDRSKVPATAIDRQLKDFERGRAAIGHQFNKVEVIPVSEQNIKLMNLLLESMDRKYHKRYSV